MWGEREVMLKLSWRRSLSIFVISFLFVFVGLKFMLYSGPVTYFWPATGFFIGITFLFGKKYLPIIFLSYFFASVLSGGNVTLSLWFAGEAILQTYVGLLAMKFFDLKERRRQWTFGLYTLGYLGAALLVGLIGATIGVAILYLHGSLAVEALIRSLVLWTVTDGLGFILIAPLMVNLKFSDLLESLSNKRVLIGVLSLFALTLAVFDLEGGRNLVFLIFVTQVYLAREKSYRINLLSGFVVYLAALMFFGLNFNIVVSRHAVQDLVIQQVLIFAVAGFALGLDELREKELLEHSSGVLILTFLLGGFVFGAYYNAELEKNDARFEELITNFERKLKIRMQAYVDALVGAKGLVLSGLPINHQIWRNYVEQMDIVNRYTGINGMGAILKVNKNDQSQFLDFAKKRFPSEFELKKVPGQESIESSAQYVITMIEPLRPNNLKAMGLDVASETNRREAADLAAASGGAAASRMIHLVQDQQKRAGFLLFVPTKVDKSKLSKDPAVQFYAFDWIYAPFVTEKFLEVPVYESSNELRMTIYDVDDKGQKIPMNRLFSNEQSFKEFNPLKRTRIIQLAQRQWQIEYSTTPEFISVNHLFSSSLLIVVVVLGLALAGMVGSVRSTAKVAEGRARELSEKIVYSSKMAALGEMASGMAHELNNPMMIVMGGGDQMKRLIDRPGPIDGALMKSIVLKVDLAIQRMARIVDGLAQFSNDSASKEFRIESVEEILNQALNLVRQKFSIANISIRESAVPNIYIECQPLQIVQVLHNLLTNSYDAIEKQTNPWIELEYLVSSKSIEIRVTDSGEGIPRAIVDKIMQPFFSTKPIGKGIGLGLSECKGIIEKHAGEFYLDPSSKNTTFVIRLPVAKSSVAKSDSAQPANELTAPSEENSVDG